MRIDPPHVDAVRHPVERPVEQVERLHVAQIGETRAVKVQVVDVLVPPEQAVELDRAGRPFGDVGGKLVEHAERALSPAEAYRVGHLAARHQPAVAEAALACVGACRKPASGDGTNPTRSPI